MGDADDFERNDVREVLTFLTDHGMLEGAAHGIALQVKSKGRLSLKGKQPKVYEEQIEKPYLHLQCNWCRIEMPTSEIVGALIEGDGLCGWCRKKKSNRD
jgi:hypothetical protein